MSSSIRPYKGISPLLGQNVYVSDLSVLVGDIQIGDDCGIWPFVAARGDVNTIRIGQRTNIQDGTVLHVTRRSAKKPSGSPLTIGDDVTIGHKAMLHGCRVGNRILIGMGAIIMDDAVIQDDVIVAAGSLVPPNKVLDSGFLYVGNPVKKARPLSDEEISFLKTSASNYVILKNDYIEEEQA